MSDLKTNYREMFGDTLGAFYEAGLVPGRMISFSKSTYRQKYPENRVFFNANIFILGEGKIWWGDLDITRDESMLKEISASCGKKLYILQELDGRFENETANDEWVLKRAVAVID